jgi:hypothetical protein
MLRERSGLYRGITWHCRHQDYDRPSEEDRTGEKAAAPPLTVFLNWQSALGARERP